MSTLRAEMHTSYDLELDAELKVVMKKQKGGLDFDGEDKEASILIVKGNKGRRTVTYGMISNLDNFGDITADTLVEAMNDLGLETFDAKVSSIVNEKVDNRHVYLLDILNTDIVAKALMSSDVGDFVEEVLFKDNKLNAQISNDDKKYSKETKIIGVVGRLDENPFKNSLMRLIQEGRYPEVDLMVDKKGQLRVVYNGRFAGELEISNTEERFDLSSVISVKCSKQKKVFGYCIEVELQKEVSNITSTKKLISDANLRESPSWQGNIIASIPKGESVDIISVSDRWNKCRYSAEIGYIEDSCFNNSVKLNSDIINSSLENTSSKNTWEINGKISSTDESSKTKEPSTIEILNNAVNSIESKLDNSNLPEDLIECLKEDLEVLKDISESKETYAVVKNEKIEKNVTGNIEFKKKADKEEIIKILSYLIGNGIPKEYAKSIVAKHRAYPAKYLEKIPHSLDANFTPWKMQKDGENLLKDALFSIEVGLNLRLVGGKGAGKNTLLSTLAWVLQIPIFSQPTNRDTDITHLFGDKTLEANIVDGVATQEVVFEPGLLVEAMEVGGLYELGEGNMCQQDVIMALSSVLDDRRSVDISGYRHVKADNNFIFATTMNVNYEGCKTLNSAFRDRFVTLKFNSSDSIYSVLKDACPHANESDVIACDKLYRHLLKLADESMSEEFITIRGYINALKLSKHISIKRALEMSVADSISDDEIISAKVMEQIDSLVG